MKRILAAKVIWLIAALFGAIVLSFWTSGLIGTVWGGSFHMAFDLDFSHFHIGDLFPRFYVTGIEFSAPIAFLRGLLTLILFSGIALILRKMKWSWKATLEPALLIAGAYQFFISLFAIWSYSEALLLSIAATIMAILVVPFVICALYSPKINAWFAADS